MVMFSIRILWKAVQQFFSAFLLELVVAQWLRPWTTYLEGCEFES